MNRWNPLTITGKENIRLAKQRQRARMTEEQKEEVRRKNREYRRAHFHEIREKDAQYSRDYRARKKEAALRGNDESVAEAGVRVPDRSRPEEERAQAR